MEDEDGDNGTDCLFPGDDMNGASASSDGSRDSQVAAEDNHANTGNKRKRRSISSLVAVK